MYNQIEVHSLDICVFDASYFEIDGKLLYIYSNKMTPTTPQKLLAVFQEWAYLVCLKDEKLV